MHNRTIVNRGTVGFIHRKEKYVVSYSVTNDGFLLPHYECVGGKRVESYDAFITNYGDLEFKIEKVFQKKFPLLRLVVADLYFSAYQAGTLPTSQYIEFEEKEVPKSERIEEKVTKSEESLSDPKKLVTKTPGYKRRTNNPAMGRPSIGSTRKVSLTLHDDVWALIDAKVAMGEKQSAVIRELIEGRAI